MKIVTSLSFQGQCREAFEFYAKVLGGKITAAMPYGDAPPGMPITDEKYKTWLMHYWLEVGDQALMGADMDIEWARNIDKPKNGFDVTLHTQDMAEARRWFDQLSEGGKAGMPITDEKYKTWLMHCWLDVGDQALMGADMDVGWASNIDKPKNGFDVTLHTGDMAEARRWFDQLSEGGKAGMPFGETFWSPGFGSLIDKFGVPWMVNVVPSADWKPPQG
jgi:PhnB protein